MARSEPRQSAYTLRATLLCGCTVAVMVVALLCGVLMRAATAQAAGVRAAAGFDARLYLPFWQAPQNGEETIVLPNGNRVNVGPQMQDLALSLDSSLLFYALPAAANPELYDVYLTDFSAAPQLVAQNVRQYLFAPATGTLYYIAEGANTGLVRYRGGTATTLAGEAERFVVSANEAHVLYTDDEMMYLLAVGAQPQVLLHNNVGAFPLAVSANGRLAYYAVPQQGAQGYALHCENLDASRQHSPLSLPGEGRVQLRLNYAATEMTVVHSGGLYAFRSSSGFRQLDEGDAQLLTPGTSLTLYLQGQMQVETLAADSLFPAVYTREAEANPGHAELRVCGYNAGPTTLAKAATQYHLSANGQTLHYLEGGTLYMAKLFAGRSSAPLTMAQGVVRFAASRSGATTAYLVAPTRYSNTGVLYHKAGGGRAVVAAENATARFALSANGQYLALLANPDLYTGQGDALLYSTAGGTQVVDGEASGVYGVTNDGAFVYAKGMAPPQPGSQWQLVQTSLYRYTAETGETEPVATDVYAYQP